VDDVSLAARLARAGILVGIPSGAALHTPLDHESLVSWQTWLVRQWLYLKFCMPAAWLAGGLVVHVLLGLVVLAGVRLVLLPLDAVAAGPALAGALFLAGLTGLGLALRSYHPQSGPLAKWLAAYFAAMGLASWCHLKTLFTMEMRWRGIVYRVGWRGRVIKIVASSQ
jgi:hypothetical protein